MEIFWTIVVFLVGLQVPNLSLYTNQCTEGGEDHVPLVSFGTSYDVAHQKTIPTVTIICYKLDTKEISKDEKKRNA